MLIIVVYNTEEKDSCKKSKADRSSKAVECYYRTCGNGGRRLVNSYYICGIMVANKYQGVEPLELAADRAMRG